MGLVELAVEDDGMPMFNRKLDGDDGRTAAMATIKNFQQVAPVCIVKNGTIAKP